MAVLCPKCVVYHGNQSWAPVPILQNGKLVGAVTHVLVNDAACSYGIFADTMPGTVRSIPTCLVIKKAWTFVHAFFVYLALSSQKATALAAATLRESTP